MNDMMEPGTAQLRPFPGLRPFTYEDHEYYFGRTSQIYSLYRLLDRSRFVAVVGTSGSGKSSLVFAGLHPLLDKETAETGGSQWVWGEMSPKNSPLEELTKLLLELAVGFTPDHDDDPVFLASQRSRIEYLLRLSSNGLVNALAAIEGLKGKSLVIVVDQFEELFRYASPLGHDPAQRARQREEAVLFVQLLLAASQHPDCTARILLTMRSDFIGDCAIFRGLPEAVSQTQCLVPGMTREQFDEVIRKPIEACKAEIDGGVVERLLIDISDEADQLPVLQHCLLRLWEKAKLDEAGKRHITVDDYNEVGRIAGALSQHADEILKKLGLDSAVERTFRALSETDKDGRATRRTVTFSQLLAETGVKAEDLSKVVDRFRADDCSFLRPMVSFSPNLSPETQIDVGHEALLRHWEKVSGDPKATGTPTDSRPIGWLREEARAGRRYQSLLYLEALPIKQVGTELDWWNKLAPTADWAQRYGGDYPHVEQLLKDGRAARSRLTQLKAGLLFLGAVLVAGCVVLGVVVDWERTSAQQSFNSSLDSTVKLLETALEDLNNGYVTITAAKQMTSYAESVIKNLGDIESSEPALVKYVMHAPGVVDIDVLQENQQNAKLNASRIQLSLTLSDIFADLIDQKDTLAQAQSAQSLAAEMAKAEPGKAQWQQYLYGADFRVADAEADQNFDDALKNYAAAQALAQQFLGKAQNDPDALYQMAFIDNKVGEAFHDKHDYSNATTQYNAALGYATSLAALSSLPPEQAAYLPSTLTKIGANAMDSGDLASALDDFAKAIAKQNELRQQYPGNPVVLGNLILSHWANAAALDRQRQANNGDFKAVFNEYDQALDAGTTLLDKDAENATWLSRQATTFDRYGAAVEEWGDINGAITKYQKGQALWQSLANRDQSNPTWAKNLDNSNATLKRLQAKPAQNSQTKPGDHATSVAKP
jgi:tetratricopeptide (TPR) repeat protein